MSNIKPLPPFKIQVLTNFPFIDADFEALTNWELYAKLVDYLNKVIVPSENELINAFNDLKDYVDNFLENLDIQEEVNNKLDEMALDGTLENLLTPIVNGILTDEKLSQIVYDIWGEDWNNLATKNYVDEKVAKYGIMPSASLDYLGKVVQYIGATNLTYTRGYFYECIDNGDTTYSWREIDFGGGSSVSSTDLYYMDNDVIIDYNNRQYASINKLIPIINEVRSANKTSFIINVRTTYASQVRGILVANIIHNTGDNTYTLSIYPRTNNNYGSYKYINNSTLFNSISSNLTLVNDEVTALSNFVESYSSDLGFLPVNNTEPYNVTTNYNPAHKKYVDDNVLKFSTMPVASNDYLGKVVQFIGTTDSTYTKGYFYECVDNGDTTYSWSEINFGGGSSTETEIYEAPSNVLLNYSSNTYNNINSLINIVNDVLSKGKDKFILKAKTRNTFSNEYDLFNVFINNDLDNNTYEMYLEVIINSANQDRLLNYTNYNNLTSILYSQLTIVDNVVTNIATPQKLSGTFTGYLASDNTTTYTPSGDYNPSTKKYVDDSVLKFTTMPTASNDYLGKVVQFIGTTDSSYTKGHFYECVSDGALTPTYSWSEISFGGGSNITTYTYEMPNTEYLDIINNTRSTDFDTNLETILNDMYSNNIYSGILIVKSNSSENLKRLFTIEVNTSYNFVDIALVNDTHNNIRYSSFQYDSTNDILKRNIYVSYLLSVNNNVVTLGSYGMNTQNHGFIEAYLTMPTASENFNKKVVQFIGTTDSSYTKGHFYECVSDGGTPATYSWSEISFGGSVDSDLIPFKKFNFSGNLYASTTLGSGYTIIRTAESQMTEFNNVIIPLLNNQIDNNIKTCNYLYCDSSGNLKLGNTYIQFTIPDNITSGTMNIRIYVFLDVYTISNDSTYSTWIDNYKRIIETSRIYSFTFDANNHITNITYGSNYKQGVILGLTPTNTRIYSVNSDYIPAHKKYVDDLPTTYTGYDATKTQVLKNINGTLTWVDET